MHSERDAVARYKVESQELSRRHRGLAAQLELLDRELEGSVNRDRQEALLAEKARITELLAETESRLRTCWDRSGGSACRKSQGCE